ncbi:MAG: EamA family transporter [Planctomycetes bacterium]|nr:EamA family transporter [Planctomycetota bacterium]
MWIVYALLSAVFSAATALFIKLGLRDMNVAYATAIRTSVVLVITWIMVWVTKGRGGEMFFHAGGRQWLFLVLSAFATAGAWLFYNQAMQLGAATRVASIDKLSLVFIAAASAAFLGENMNLTAIFAIALITGGTVLLVFS